MTARVASAAPVLVTPGFTPTLPRKDLFVSLRLMRYAHDPVALACAILRALPPWPEALRVARAIIEADTANAPKSPFARLAAVAERVAESAPEAPAEDEDTVYGPRLP